MEIKTIYQIEKQAYKKSHFDLIRIGLGLFFLVMVMAFSYAATGSIPNNMFLTIATVFGGYMAMNIGANDVANNVGPAVGSKALTMGGAIIIAMVFEASGSFIAGGDVVSTIKGGIIDIQAFTGHTDKFIWAMMAALLAAALWLNMATYAKVPVSTTHSIVGGVVGAGIAASGFGIVDWITMAKITTSWIISPIIGGFIAALFLYAIKRTVIYRDDMVAAAYKWVPVYVALMAWSFITYLILKGLHKIWGKLVAFLGDLLSLHIAAAPSPSFTAAAVIGAIAAILVYILMKRRIRAQRETLKNTRNSVNVLFTIPLIFAAALLSFAHGANDVANAIGPLAAINDGVMTGGIATKAGIPFWVMAVGAFGIAIGLALYGPRLIRTVGGEITELDQMRAFSIAMAAAVTVIFASQLGLPVSSTHIAIGGVFGVGFLREWLEKSHHLKQQIEQEKVEINDEQQVLKALRDELATLEANDEKTIEQYQRITVLYQRINEEEFYLRQAQKTLKKEKKTRYVKRDLIKKIVTAWLITVPTAAVLSAGIYYMIKGIMS